MIWKMADPRTKKIRKPTTYLFKLKPSSCSCRHTDKHVRIIIQVCEMYMAGAVPRIKVAAKLSAPYTAQAQQHTYTITLRVDKATLVHIAFKLLSTGFTRAGKTWLVALKGSFLARALCRTARGDGGSCRLRTEVQTEVATWSSVMQV